MVSGLSKMIMVRINDVMDIEASSYMKLLISLFQSKLCL